jgi:predicted DNA-binding transcriptional regulator AlpA
MEEEDVLLTTDQVAEYLQVAIGTVENWRQRKPYTGPPYMRLRGDGVVRYRKSDLITWVDQQMVSHG